MEPTNNQVGRYELISNFDLSFNSSAFNSTGIDIEQLLKLIEEQNKTKWSEIRTRTRAIIENQQRIDAAAQNQDQAL